MSVWWLGTATSFAVVSGLGGAFLMTQGRFIRGGVLLALSVVALRWPRSIWDAAPAGELPLRVRRLGLLAVCAVAVFFRCYHLEPPGIWGDDAINGQLALDVLEGKITSPFQLVAHAYSIFHALTNFAIAGAFWLFGPGPVTLRLPGVIAGILCVPLLYGTMLPLFGARVALLASLFLASSPVQISHSKTLIQIVFGQFFMLLGMCALVRGVMGRRHWLAASAGAPVALTLYTYHSAKVAPVVALLFLCMWLWRAGGERRRILLDLVGFLAVLALCSIPAVQSYRAHPEALTGRANAVAVWPAVRASGSLWPLWTAVSRTLLIFHFQQGPIYHWFGIGSDPAFNVVLGFLVIHGMVESLRHCTAPRHTLLLGWVLLGLIPGFLSSEAPRVYRVLLATPPLYVWAALPIAQLDLSCVARARRRLRWLVALVVLSVPIIDFNYYFYRVYTHPEFRWYQSTRLVEMARRLRALGPGWTGYVLSGGFGAGYETLAFLSRAWGLTFQDVHSLADVLPVHDEPEGGALFIIDRGMQAVTPVMRSFYPGVAVDVVYDPPIRTWWFDRWLPLVPQRNTSMPTVAFFPVSRQAADSIRGTTVTFFGADGTPLRTRVERELGLPGANGAGSGHVTPTQAEWSGALYAPTDGTYTFLLESNGSGQVWIDGAPLVSHEAPRTKESLAQGLHRFTARATLSDSPVFRLYWQPPGNDAPIEIPPAFWFRQADVHGLLATYTLSDRTLRRIEPYPYYAFFGETFPPPFSVNWRGQLRVPAPGGCRIEPIASGRTTVLIDGQRLQKRESLAEGTYDFEMQMADVRGPLRLSLLWRCGDADREPIPPDALRPPDAHPPSQSENGRRVDRRESTVKSAGRAKRTRNAYRHTDAVGSGHGFSSESRSSRL